MVLLETIEEARTTRQRHEPEAQGTVIWCLGPIKMPRISAFTAPLLLWARGCITNAANSGPNARSLNERKGVLLAK